ncbi:glycosyltransferase [Pseudomonas soli]|uniref:glycosyltransferase n=1 Tax=Pseudomonas soli TaxID=1306993 RepID=UPI003CFD3B8D
MLTIVIPSYNHADYIADSLQAALAVDVPGLKVLVIDDGSKDGSVDVVKACIDREGAANKVTLIAKTNGGLVSSLNLALEMIDTEFCWVVASDDILVSFGVKVLFEKIKDNAALSFIMGGGHYFDEQARGGEIYKKEHMSFFALEAAQRDREIFLGYPSPLLLQSSIFRTDALRKIGGWDPALKWDDYPIFVKLLQRYRHRGQDFDFIPDVDCVAYRQHGENSYRNIYSQYSMVCQAMNALAPADLRAKAIARAFAFYALVALKRRKLAFFRQAIKGASLRQIAWGFACIPMVATRYVLMKL